MHPCRGAVRGTQNRWCRSRSTTVQAGMPPASHSDAFICFFCFRRMLLCRRIRSACHKSSISLLRNRTTPPFSIKCALGHLTVQAEARHFQKPHFRGPAPSLLTQPIENSEEPKSLTDSPQTQGRRSPRSCGCWRAMCGALWQRFPQARWPDWGSIAAGR